MRPEPLGLQSAFRETGAGRRSPFLTHPVFDGVSRGLANMNNDQRRNAHRDLEARRRNAVDAGSEISSPERRSDSRQAAHQHVAIRFRSFNLICDLVDLSERGARVCVLDGIVPNNGETVVLTLFDGTVIEGKVSGLRDKYIAVAFAAPISEVSERLDFENLGRAYFGKAVALQKSTRR